jgi:hypothetical protein
MDDKALVWEPFGDLQCGLGHRFGSNRARLSAPALIEPDVDRLVGGWISSIALLVVLGG